MTFSQELKNKFIDFISGRCGLYFKDHDLKNLKNAVTKRVKACGLDSVSAYYIHLTTSAKKENEFRELLNRLTVNHTYFFRNKPQLRALREKILPEIIKRKKKNLIEKPSLRIWSAGCSTGEEPYTVAMMIRETIEDPDYWDIEIYATDASTDALKKARKGIYGENSIKPMSRRYRNKYFVEIEDSKLKHQYALDPAIKQMVHFDYLNLIEDDFPRGFDIIFCRNVIIYFELKTTIKVMNKLHSALADNGYLFVGYSESLQFISDKFKMVCWQDTLFYCKAPKTPISKLEIPESPAAEVEKIIEEISKAELTAEEKIETPKRKPPATKIKDLLVRIIKALHMKEYDQALNLIEKTHTIDKKAVEPYYLAAEIYVNQGKFNMAKEELKLVLKLDTLFAPAYYLFGTIYIEEDELEAAKKSLKKVLYLDKNFTPAYYSLAAIYRKEGRTEDAIREYRNTLEVLSKESPDNIIAYSGGFNAATLISVCKNNIERIKAEEWT